MHATIYWDSLRKVLTDFRRLDSGWRPGKAELDGVRLVEQVIISPPKDGAPFGIIGSINATPGNYRLVITSLFAIDLGDRWARTFDGWVAIGEQPRKAIAFGSAEIRRIGTAWLWAELERLRPLAGHLTEADRSVFSSETAEQFIELRRTRH